jgi:hypothetical protein
MWREGLGCYNIVTSDKKGYRNHPATKEFIGNAKYLWHVLSCTRTEMLRRGYNPREMPDFPSIDDCEEYKPWQTLEEQIEVLKDKGCKCKV